MKTRALMLLAASALFATSLVQAAPENAVLFEQFKQLETQSHQGRIAVLQDAHVCIQKAQNHEEYRACEKNERDGRKVLREELKPQREALREQAKAMGITMRPQHSGHHSGSHSGHHGMRDCGMRD